MTTAGLYRNYRPGTGPSARPTVSFELYPPRSSNPRAGIWQRIDRLTHAAPDYVSVTYGAGGVRNQDSLNVLSHIGRMGGVPGVCHLTCIGQAPATLEALVERLLRSGQRNFLAIRGDLPQGASPAQAIAAEAATGSVGSPTQNDAEPLQRAAQLVRLIRRVAARILPDGVGTGPGGTGISTATNPGNYVSIAVAFYPASSGRARTNDIAAVLEKQQCGADYAISQVFYHADDYVSFLHQATIAGVRIPLIPGIIPLTDIKRLNRLEELSGVTVPSQLTDLLVTSDGRMRVSEGLRATLNLCNDVVLAGAPGLHVFSFNRPRPALDVLAYIRGGGLLRSGGIPSNELHWSLLDGALGQITPAS